MLRSSLNKGIFLSSRGMPKRAAGESVPKSETQTKGYVVEVNSTQKRRPKSPLRLSNFVLLIMKQFNPRNKGNEIYLGRKRLSRSRIKRDRR